MCIEELVYKCLIGYAVKNRIGNIAVFKIINIENAVFLIIRIVKHTVHVYQNTCDNNQIRVLIGNGNVIGIVHGVVNVHNRLFAVKQAFIDAYRIAVGPDKVDGINVIFLNESVIFINNFIVYVGN